MACSAHLSGQAFKIAAVRKLKRTQKRQFNKVVEMGRVREREDKKRGGGRGDVRMTGMNLRAVGS